MAGYSSRPFERVLLVLLLTTGVALAQTAPATAGVKVGAYFPLSSDYDPGFAFAFDGRFRMTDRLRLGFEALFVPNLGGVETLYYDGDFFGYSEEKVGSLGMRAVTAGAWWFLTERLYAGLGVGYYGTGVAGEFSYSTGGDYDPPHGFTARATLGFMQKPPGRSRFLFFGEVSYQHCAGSGIVESRNDTMRVSDPSGLAAFVGVTF